MNSDDQNAPRELSDEVLAEVSGGTGDSDAATSNSAVTELQRGKGKPGRGTIL